MSTEISALQKFNCPACGAEAHWNPSRHALVCPYCSTVSPAELSADGSMVKEHDLALALRGLSPEQRGWQAETKSVRCKNCNAISIFNQTRIAQRCDFCGSPSIVPIDQVNAPIRPESLLPFLVSETKVREKIRAWYASHWFAPNKLKTRALTDTVHGIYLPYWTFDAAVQARWTAEAGYYYYETEVVRDRDGRSVSRQVRRVRWQYAEGELAHFFDDELVPASKGVDASLLRAVEPFPTTDLRPYDPGYVSGWVVEQYQIDLVAAAEHSREVMNQKLRALCSAQVPGDTQRNLQVQAQYNGQTFKHILAPIWLLNYTYGSRTFQCIVNGVNGRIAGRYPISWVKVLFVVLLGLVMLGLFFAFQAGG